MGYQKNHLKKDQRGVVAITVTVFFVIILSLIVLAFSQAARREQRQTLDNQLAKQAFYAAETGINVTMKGILDKSITAGGTDCNSTGKNVSNDGNIAYSCVLYDLDPDDIVIDSVNVESGETIPLSVKNPTNDPSKDLKDIEIVWRDTQPDGIFSGCADGSPNSVVSYSGNETGCDAGMLRVYLMKFVVNNTREQMVSSTFSAFLRPAQAGSGSVAYSAYGAGGPTSSQGQVVASKCDAGYCKAIITGIGGGENYINVRSIGKSNSITIRGIGADLQPVSFDEAQVKIDATGKANDVVRRLQVRKPLSGRYSTSPFTIDALDGVCKLLQTWPDGTVNGCPVD